MKIAVICNEELKQELLARGEPAGIEPVWQETIEPVTGAVACLDLMFQHTPERIAGLQSLRVPLILVNAVGDTLAELPAGFVRINGWKTFLKRETLEAAAAETEQPLAEKLMAGFHKKIQWVPDTPGFVSARVIAMIINEAYRTWEEGVSSKEEIDTAMKLGTNHPYGPFEWANLIGVSNVNALLQKLTTTHERYRPAASLEKEGNR